MTDANLRKFFHSKLMMLQAAVRPTVFKNIDQNCESYFEQVFEPASIVSQEELIDSLVAIWRRLEMHGLVALESDFRKMAKELRVPESTDHKISDFIYAMY